MDRFHFDANGERLTAIVHRPNKPIGATLLLGHGASAGQRDPFIVEYALGLAERGILVVTYDFPFAEHARQRPDRDEVLKTACSAAIAAARECRPKNRLFLGGKSLGGRIATELVAERDDETADVAGIVVLGYPLHPIGKPDAPRAAHFADLPVPVLFVQGTRDPFGTPDSLRPFLRGMPKGTSMHVVEGGDHSFLVPRRDKSTQREIHEAVEDEIAHFLTVLTETPKTTRARAKPIASRVERQLRTLRRAARA